MWFNLARCGFDGHDRKRKWKQPWHILNQPTIRITNTVNTKYRAKQHNIYNDITAKLRQTQDNNESVQMQIQPEYESRDRNTRKPTKCMAIHPCTFFCCARAFYSFVATQRINVNSWLRSLVEKNNMVNEWTVHINNADTTTSTQTGRHQGIAQTKNTRARIMQRARFVAHNCTCNWLSGAYALL